MSERMRKQIFIDDMLGEGQEEEPAFHLRGIVIALVGGLIMWAMIIGLAWLLYSLVL